MLEICRMTFGSHLYGTDTEQSDKDFKGVFLPSKRELILGQYPKSVTVNTKDGNSQKNTSDDIDVELYSLHYFIHLACEGETVALDMLHAPSVMTLVNHPIWQALVTKRGRFYTKNLKAFIGYARKQASKYGVKGSRLNDAYKVIDYFYSINSAYRLSNVWDCLPTGEHIHKHEDVTPRTYEVCGRQIQETVLVSYGLEIVERFYDNYGARAAQAARNEGIDWKAVSHAFRAAYQVKQILTEGTITFPLREADYLKKIKSGVLSYIDEVSPKLDELISEVEELSTKSLLPVNVDHEYWDNFIVGVIEEYVL